MNGENFRARKEEDWLYKRAGPGAIVDARLPIAGGRCPEGAESPPAQLTFGARRESVRRSRRKRRRPQLLGSPLKNHGHLYRAHQRFTARRFWAVAD